MKKLLIGILFLTAITACSSDDTLNNNPNLLDVNVNFQIDLSLPQYNSLNFPSSPIYIPNYGNAGVVIMKNGADSFVAFDAADPNHPRKNECVAMELDGIQIFCGCEGNTYDLYTGGAVEGDEEDLRYPLFRYRVIKGGNGLLNVRN